MTFIPFQSSVWEGQYKRMKAQLSFKISVEDSNSFWKEKRIQAIIQFKHSSFSRRIPDSKELHFIQFPKLLVIPIQNVITLNSLG